MAKVVIENSSGIMIPETNNPYDGLIEVCKGDPKAIQDVYQKHRLTRNSQQAEKILADNFTGWVLDDHLLKLDGIQRDPIYVDPRNCLVGWARPPKKVRNLVDIIQSKLKDAAPDLWLMPLENLHTTVMEVTHSRTVEEIDQLKEVLEPSCQAFADYTRTHRTRLIKPTLSYDSTALALSFVPAAGECPPRDRKATDDDYTYHHLRRDLYHILTESGLKVGSRYVVPTSHLTIARFNSPNVFGGDPLDIEATKDRKKRQHWIKEIDMINKWLEAEYWPKEDSNNIKAGGEWMVGEEKGLVVRSGRVWYGGGESMYEGKGY